ALIPESPERQFMLSYYYLLRLSLVAIMLVAILSALVSCGSEQGSSEQGTTEETAPPAAETAEATQPEEEPAGVVVEIGDAPEGIAADPETGLVAVGLRDPDGLALVDGSSGEVIRNVELPESPRHLSLAGPGGPVLVPAEDSDTLVQVGLPGGEILSETPVGANPHDAAAAPNGRIFVGNESGDTASVVEGDREVETVETAPQPGGVAVTNDGLVGIVSVSGLVLEVYEASTLELLGSADTGEGPTHVVTGPENRFYVTDTSGDAILVYETRPEPEQTGRVSLPDAPYGIAIDPGRGHLWVTTENQLVQYALEEGTLRELARYPTVREPYTVAVDTASGRVFVTGRADGELQILDPQ
ncbi:MAG: YncE family protein, partial [Actinomycetota bacterium]|nr:YncE family protein [Actinomycetota bacterium]